MTLPRERSASFRGRVKRGVRYDLAKPRAEFPLVKKPKPVTAKRPLVKKLPQGRPN